ncbi:MAG: hypothetical protein VKO39_00595 [Cyanobacteriota bacterium]|nr:hypothetical protein [Cyanobacteriota bacterium]
MGHACKDPFSIKAILLAGIEGGCAKTPLEFVQDESENVDWIQAFEARLEAEHTLPLRLCAIAPEHMACHP